MKKRDLIILVLSIILLYVVGQFRYEQLYRLTLFLIKSSSNVPLNFYGKYPWFGSTKFSLILASIPLLIFLTSKILTKFNNQIPITGIIYIFLFAISYIIYCWLVAFSLVASNDFYKSGDEHSYNLSEINMNEIFAMTIGLATLSTSIILLLVNIVKKRQRKTTYAQNK